LYGVLEGKKLKQIGILFKVWGMSDLDQYFLLLGCSNYKQFLRLQD